MLFRSCIDYLSVNYCNKDLSQETVSGLFHLSPSYFGALFKSVTGKTFVQYLNNLRVENAYRMLTSSNMKIYQIAEKVGFSDVHYFIRVFRKIAGTSPNQYRAVYSPGKGGDP